MKPEYIKRHADLLRQNAANCTLLLKKDGQFPLEKPCKIAIFGNGARKTVKGGTGSGDVIASTTRLNKRLKITGLP